MIGHPNITVTFTSKQATFIRQALGVALNRAPGVFDAEQIDALTDADAALRGDEPCGLEAIVRDLADLDEPIYDYIDCFLCGVIGDHAETCPWRRAVEWVDQPSRRRQR